jgi:hypothetical protein
MLDICTVTRDKLKASVLTVPQICEFMSDLVFENSVHHLEKQAWHSLKKMNNFQGNTRRPDCKDIVQNLLEHFKNVGCNMSIKLHFLHFHIDYFPQNLGSISEEHGERFDQDIREMEKRCKCGHTANIMAD